MKKRNDFVTNSSSSSFIMAFKDEDDYKEFAEHCEWMDYQEVYKMIERMRPNSSKIQEIKEMVYGYFSHDKQDEVLKTCGFDISPCDYLEKIKALETEECQREMQRQVEADPEYVEVMKRINESNIVVDGMVWDTSGGVFEWAVRNGFLKNEFWQWCVLNWNIG